MHTLKVIDGPPHDRLEWYIHHNGDYSGSVKISNQVEDTSFRVPFSVLKAVVADYLRDKKISELEQASVDDILFGKS